MFTGYVEGERQLFRRLHRLHHRHVPRKDLRYGIWKRADAVRSKAHGARATDACQLVDDLG